jgi:hypothetical protein
VSLSASLAAARRDGGCPTSTRDNARDAEEFANQFPAYRENPVEETRRAPVALETEQHFAQRYTEFLQLVVYGVKPDFAEAMATIASLVRRL